MKINFRKDLQGNLCYWIFYFRFN